eukprot:TRINITY_DN234_c0_g2_i1.p2 TRINITY_DN234_c0_g2~~TRINITY_DN234_c0_g2_i1.p2  ORF type:complete len:194 (+),score=35.00 TRINITY_DN234_c0_g2_i1:6782-7363(+)
MAFTQPGDPLLLTFDHRSLHNEILFDARFLFATRKEHSSNPLQSRRAATQLPAMHDSPPAATIPHSHSDHVTTSIRQPITTHPLHTPSLHVRQTQSHQSPSSPRVSPSQPDQGAYMEAQHPQSPPQRVSFASPERTPERAASATDAASDDDEGEGDADQQLLNGVSIALPVACVVDEVFRDYEERAKKVPNAS